MLSSQMQPLLNPTQTKNNHKPMLILSILAASVLIAGLSWSNFHSPSELQAPISEKVVSAAEIETLLTRFAPVIMLFPYDTNRPSSVEHYFGISNLMNADGTLSSSTVTSELLGTSAATKYLKMKIDGPTGGNPRMTGEAVNSANGQSPAPLYAHLTEESGILRLTYAIFYPFNGFQTFRLNYKSGFLGLTDHTRNIEWSPFASHESDWEYVHVFISASTKVMLGVSLSVHGDENTFAAAHVTRKTGSPDRPVVYSAWNSHAMYFSKMTHTLEEMKELEYQAWIPNPMWIWNAPNAVITTIMRGHPWVTAINWMKGVDTTQPGEEIDKYLMPTDYHTSPQLDVSYNGKLIVTNGKEDDPAFQWLKFNGAWGPNMDNSNVDPVPDIEGQVDKDLAALAFLIGTFKPSLIPSKANGGAKGPQTKGWWDSVLTTRFKNQESSKWLSGRGATLIQTKAADMDTEFILTRVHGTWDTYTLRDDNALRNLQINNPPPSAVGLSLQLPNPTSTLQQFQITQLDLGHDPTWYRISTVTNSNTNYGLKALNTNDWTSIQLSTATGDFTKWEKTEYYTDYCIKSYWTNRYMNGVTNTLINTGTVENHSHWIFQRVLGTWDYYYIRDKESGLYLQALLPGVVGIYLSGHKNTGTASDEVQHWQVKQIQGTIKYKIRPRNFLNYALKPTGTLDGAMVTVTNTNVGDNADWELEKCKNTPQYNFLRLRNKPSNNYLNAYGATGQISKAADWNTLMVLSRIAGTYNVYTIEAVNIAAGGVARVLQLNCASCAGVTWAFRSPGQALQEWEIFDVGDVGAYYHIKLASNGNKALKAMGSVDGNSVQAAPVSGDYYKWEIVPSATWWRFKSMGTDKFLRVQEGWITSTVTPTKGWTNMWQIERVSGTWGCVRIWNSARVMYLKDAGATAVLASRNAADTHQQWCMEAIVGTQQFFIKNTGSGKYLSSRDGTGSDPCAMISDKSGDKVKWKVIID